MPQTRKIRRLLAWVIAGLCAMVLLPAVAIRVDQYLLRRNAERFLADLKSLEMRKSTYHDAQQVIDHWKGHWKGITRQEGPCESNRCDVEIGVADFFDHHWGFFIHHQGLMQAWRFLGGRPAQIDGYIRVRRGIVWGKGIRAIVLSSSTRHADQDDINLIGRSGSGSLDFISSSHPEYEVGIGRATTGASSSGAYADFTPYADPADVNRLMDIDFSCLTRWHSCQTGADIATTAWNEATVNNEKEKEKRLTTNFAELPCSPGVIQVLARESRRAVIGEVSRIELYPGPYGDSSFANVKILLQDDLKQCNLSALMALQDYSFSQSLPVKQKPGDRFILFFKYKDRLYLDNDRACALLPATQENIEAARRGVAEDWADHNDEF
jgi:hypothetical protein